MIAPTKSLSLLAEGQAHLPLSLSILMGFVCTRCWVGEEILTSKIGEYCMYPDVIAHVYDHTRVPGMASDVGEYVSLW